MKNPNGTGYVRAPFPGNFIPASDFDPTSAKLLSLFPTPNLPGKNNFFSNQKETIAQDQYVGRIDHHFSERDSVFGRVSESGNTNLLPGASAAAGQRSEHCHSLCAIDFNE